MKRKKKEMDDVFICDKSIEKANNIGLILSTDLYNLNKEIIENEKNKLLKEVSCENISEYFIKLEKIFKDSHYVNKLVSGKEKISEVQFSDILIMKNEIKKDQIKIISIFQKIMCLNLLDKNIFNKIFYLPCFMDNRGRQYYGTLISPTFHIIFRYLYKFSKEKEFVDLEKSRFYKEIMKYSYIINKNNLNNREIYTAIVLFIEIGKFFIKDTNNYDIKTSYIIEKGIEKYNIKCQNVKIEDLLYIKKIYSLLDNLFEKRYIDNNALIFKDATASGLQNYGIILGYKINMLKYLNINNDD
jgi:hypothetical protein